MEYKVKDIGLAPKGRLKIQWAENHMPVLMKIRRRFRIDEPLRKVKVGACLHVTKETAVLVETLKAGGATIALCASNPLTTQDEVAAALCDEGVHVFAWRGETTDDYWENIDRVIDYNPTITLDDGADMTERIHKRELTKGIIGGCEETTTGVNRLRSMAGKGVLKYPILAVNDAQTKWDFDNVYGTGQSTIDGIVRATNVLLAGKTFVVAGYGHCGRGVAMRAKGMGAHVIVTEVDPIKALRAKMEGYRVMSMIEAAKIGDIFVTVTGNKNVVRKEHMELMKDGAIIANSGHFNVEICIPDLESLATEKRRIKGQPGWEKEVSVMDEYTLNNGRRLYLLTEGRLVNLSAAEGHPSEVMDMSFSNQALCVEYLIIKSRELKPDLYKVPLEIDRKVAVLKLDAMGIQIDELTTEQEEYLKTFGEGTI